MRICDSSPGPVRKCSGRPTAWIDFLAADIQFHVEILHATGNPFFAPIANVISASLESSLRVTNRQPTDNHASVPVHQKVMKAICARKPARAQAAMRSLLNEAADRIDSALGDA